MLVLTRKAGESIVIGNQVKLTVLEIQGRQIRLGIEAPMEVPVHRGEVYERIKEENQSAAQGDDAGLKALSRVWKGKPSDS